MKLLMKQENLLTLQKNFPSLKKSTNFQLGCRRNKMNKTIHEMLTALIQEKSTKNKSFYMSLKYELKFDNTAFQESLGSLMLTLI